jgi:DNA-directed RNA polymerase specialized sigma24 family protein
LRQESLENAQPHLLNNALPLASDDDAANPPARLHDLETPEKLTLTDDIRDAVNYTLDRLSEEHRTVITLREIGGLSYKEIASAMSVPIGTVRSRVFRARDLIDHQLRRVHDGGLGRAGPANARAIRRPPSDSCLTVENVRAGGISGLATSPLADCL